MQNVVTAFCNCYGKDENSNVKNLFCGHICDRSIIRHRHVQKGISNNERLEATLRYTEENDIRFGLDPCLQNRLLVAPGSLT